MCGCFELQGTGFWLGIHLQEPSPWLLDQQHLLAIGSIGQRIEFDCACGRHE